MFKDFGDGILVTPSASGAGGEVGIPGSTRILEDGSTVRDIEDGDDRILEG
jgi:hypothetical protein